MLQISSCGSIQRRGTTVEGHAYQFAYWQKPLQDELLELVPNTAPTLGLRCPCDTRDER